MGIGLVSVRFCNNLCFLLSNNLYFLLDNNLGLLLDNNICLLWDYVYCWILPSVDIFYLIGILGSSTFNFHLVNRVLINWECRCFSTFNLIISLPLILYPTYHYFLDLLSTNHKCTQPCPPAAQKLKQIWDSLMRSFRQAITLDR
jgi:hypothetical protein